MAKIVSIHSYRGGTGKSNLTANLATAIALQGNRVAVIDTDIPSPGIHVIFGLDDQKIDKTLNDYLWGRCTIADAAYNVTPPSSNPSGGQVFLVPSSVNADEIARILNQGYDFRLLNDGLRQLVRQLEIDYLLIDTHPGLNKETLLSIAVSNLVLLILRPDQQDFQGTAVTVDVARQLDARQMLLIVNKVLSSMDQTALREQVTQTYKVPVAGVFTLSEEMIYLASNGIFFLRYPDHPFSQELRRVVAQVIG
ncbi:MinD/ParA family protein [Thermoleptolyngbya sp. C42_A2020_037]|uniref:MinD/ParA family ATP-binding protein n=1 Tax=Thermoleptolyngbya sp. C42_A2020_037 TaxID=2747799 RepID=UPI0019FB6782|nr:MinD/ParA family protein [Thermoleptolyngbya sp. C42_A2020_037]MBF2083155.1 MinD/ParA family protein [Thermoleptolyngbya sp. C42_A2020_037]